jgi:hypothetical protein
MRYNANKEYKVDPLRGGVKSKFKMRTQVIDQATFRKQHGFNIWTIFRLTAYHCETCFCHYTVYRNMTMYYNCDDINDVL